MVLTQKPFSVQDMKCLEINDNASAIEVNEERAFQCMYASNVSLQPSDEQHALSILLSPDYDNLCDAWQAGIESGANCNSELQIYNDAVAFPGAVIDSSITGVDSFWNGQFAITKVPNSDFPLTLTNDASRLSRQASLQCAQASSPCSRKLKARPFLPASLSPHALAA